MSATSLLLWMSARGEGSWEQFRAAVEELHLGDNGEAGTDSGAEEIAEEAGLPLYHLLRLNLQRLGHAEFNAGAAGSDWKVTPPCIAVSELRGGCVGVVAGARSRALLGRLSECGRTVDIESRPCTGAPDMIRIRAGNATVMATIATLTGLRVQVDAATAILMSLPAIDDREVWRRGEIQVGADWKIERFAVETLSWRPGTRTEAQNCAIGLFRFSLRYRRHVFLCVRQKGVFEVPIQVGKYILLRRRHRRLWRYDPSDNRLTVPASCRPPFLVERALLTCSGMLPDYEAQVGTPGFLHYADIPVGVAQLACAVLRQELQ